MLLTADTNIVEAGIIPAKHGLGADDRPIIYGGWRVRIGGQLHGEARIFSDEAAHDKAVPAMLREAANTIEHALKL